MERSFLLINNIKMANGSVDPNFARWFGRAVVLAAKTAEHPTIAFKRQLAENSLRKNQEIRDCFRKVFVIVTYELFLLSTRSLITAASYLPAVVFALYFIFFHLLFILPMIAVTCRYSPHTQGIKEESEMCTARNITLQVNLNGTFVSFVVNSEAIHFVDSIFYVLGALLFPHFKWCDAFSKYYSPHLV
jgi:hypothetical protein